MTKYLNCLITHGDMAKSMKLVVEKLVGQESNLYCFSNQTSGFEEIEAKISELAAEQYPTKIIIFVDLMGGSCWVASNRLKHKFSNLTIAAGVNIPMLVSYFINIERLEWPELMEKISADAKKGVVVR